MPRCVLSFFLHNKVYDILKQANTGFWLWILLIFTVNNANYELSHPSWGFLCIVRSFLTTTLCLNVKQGLFSVITQDAKLPFNTLLKTNVMIHPEKEFMLFPELRNKAKETKAWNFSTEKHVNCPKIHYSISMELSYLTIPLLWKERLLEGGLLVKMNGDFGIFSYWTGW